MADRGLHYRPQQGPLAALSRCQLPTRSQPGHQTYARPRHALSARSHDLEHLADPATDGARLVREAASVGRPDASDLEALRHAIARRMDCARGPATRMVLDPEARSSAGPNASLGADLVPDTAPRQVRLRVDVAPRRVRCAPTGRSLIAKLPPTIEPPSTYASSPHVSTHRPGRGSQRWLCAHQVSKAARSEPITSRHTSTKIDLSS